MARKTKKSPLEEALEKVGEKLDENPNPFSMRGRGDTPAIGVIKKKPANSSKKLTLVTQESKNREARRRSINTASASRHRNKPKPKKG